MRRTPLILPLIFLLLLSPACALDGQGGLPFDRKDLVRLGPDAIGVRRANSTGRFSAVLPVKDIGGEWIVASFTHTILALQPQTERPATITVAVRDQPLDAAEERWRAVFQEKGFTVETRRVEGGLLLLAEGNEPVSGPSQDVVLLQAIPSGGVATCSVGAPREQAAHYVNLLQRVCDSLVLD